MTLLAPVSKSLAATCLKEPPDVITSSNSNTFLPLYCSEFSIKYGITFLLLVPLFLHAQLQKGN